MIPTFKSVWFTLPFSLMAVATLTPQLNLATGVIDLSNPASPLLTGPNIFLSQANRMAGVTFQRLHSFDGGLNGQRPRGQLVLYQGNLYGVTESGGTRDYGIIYRLSSNGTGFTNLHSFNPNPNPAHEGANPGGGLTLYNNVLYGTTYLGGLNNGGTVYRSSPGGSVAVLRAFPTSNSDGAFPLCDLLRVNSRFYGTTTGGVRDDTAGTDSSNGTVFQFTPGNPIRILYRFRSGSGKPNKPVGWVIPDGAGNLYGVTQKGGSSRDAGVLFKLSPTGSLTILKRLGGSLGAEPLGGLIKDSAGNFYGTTSTGGQFTFGTLFKWSSSGTFSILRHFNQTLAGGGVGGGAPLTIDAAGNLYGITNGGGISNGTVFRYSTATKKLTVLYNFDGSTANGVQPSGPLLLRQQSNGVVLYGTTLAGGQTNNGVVFKLTVTQ